MPTSFCFIQVRPGGVPELRLLDGEDDDQVAQGLAAVLAEWPQVHQVEITDGDRRVWTARGAEIDRVRHR